MLPFSNKLKISVLAIIFINLLYLSACRNDKPCETIDCGAHGACVIGKDFEPQCLCEPGWYGNMCEFYDPCLLITCLNNGSKEVSPDDTTKCLCICPPEFTGEFCETQNFCLGVTCQNGGTPVNEPATFSCSCSCPPGFIGQFCQLPDPCFGFPCPPNAGCQLTANQQPQCVCNAGWEGSNCETEIREKYIGVYNARSIYADGSSTTNYVCTITKHPDDVTKMFLSHLLVNNSGSNPIELKDAYAVVYQSNTFALPLQLIFPNNEVVKSVSIGQRNSTTGVVTVFYTYEKNNTTTQLQLELTPQ